MTHCLIPAVVCLSLLILTRTEDSNRTTLIWFGVCDANPLHSQHLCCPASLSFPIHSWISNCAVVELERGKRSKIAVALVKTVLEKSHWMSCLWMHHSQTVSWIHSRRLVPNGPKLFAREHKSHAYTHSHNNTQTYHNVTEMYYPP